MNGWLNLLVCVYVFVLPLHNEEKKGKERFVPMGIRDKISSDMTLGSKFASDAPVASTAAELELCWNTSSFLAKLGPRSIASPSLNGDFNAWFKM